MSTEYSRPVKAALYVHLENGEKFPATQEDLAKFGVGSILDAYMRFDDALGDALRRAELVGRDITDAELNPVRYLAELAICHSDLLDHADHDGWSSVAELERRLQATKQAGADR